MKITIEPSETGNDTEPNCCRQHAVTVDHPSDALDISDIVDLVRMALLAWGYAESTVEGEIAARRMRM